MVLFGYTGSWWHEDASAERSLGFNLNWGVVMGVPK